MDTFPPIPSAYSFESDLHDGFLSRTAIVTKNGIPGHYVCKCIESSRLGGRANCDKFIDTIRKTSLVRSRFLLPYEEVIEVDKFIFLFRPFLNSPTLEEQVSRDDDPNMNGYLVLWKAVVRSFKKLHSIEVWPNFIRPSNIFIADDGAPIVTDIYMPVFNAANPQSAKSLSFLAPEFIQGEELPGKEADVWSLALLLLYIITGELPWDTKNLMRMMMNIMQGHPGLKVEVPGPLRPMIEAAIVVDPKQRFTLNQLFNQNPEVATLKRKEKKMTSQIRVQQSVLMKSQSPKIQKPICTRQSLQSLPVVSSFIEPKRTTKDPFFMD